MGATKTINTDSGSDNPDRTGEPPMVTWSHPKRNLWVAFRHGQPAGSVEMVAEHFVSCDEVGKHRGAHPDLRLAQQAVESGW
jgi:hypothetical protein